MACGFGDHVMLFSFHNPHDNRDVYECMNCGKVTSKDAGPLFEYQITCQCCGVPHAAHSKSATPFMNVGDPWDCPDHGASVITAITSRQIKGKTVTASAKTSVEPTTSDGVLGCLVVLVIVGLLLAGCVAVIR